MIRALLVDPSSRGGIAAYTALIAESLTEAGVCAEILGSLALEKSGSTVPVTRLLPDDGWGKPRRTGVEYYAQRMITWSRTALIIQRYARRHRPDVIHFQAPINRRFDARLLRRLAQRAPVVWTAHDALPYERTERDEGWFGAIYREADAVVAHNELTADEVRKVSGVDSVVIDHPVRQGIVQVTQATARRRLDLSDSGRILAAIGFIRPYKGYDLLADVWERLGDDAPLLLVIGELIGDSERDVVDRLALHPRVDLRLGYVSDEEFELAAIAADALLLPHREASDSGLLHLARAVSVPVIAAEIPELATVVEATAAGWVVPRDVDRWANAVTAPLPPPPPPPPGLREVGARHLELYERVIDNRVPLLRPFRLAVYVDAVQIAGAEAMLGYLVEGLDPAIELTVVGTDERVVEWVARRRGGAAMLLLPPVRDKRDAGPIYAHMKALWTLRPEIFQANLQHPWACQYGLAAALLVPGTKAIAVEHLPTPPTSPVQRWLKQVTSKRLDAHVIAGNTSARQLERLIGLRRCSIRTIPYGIRWTPPVPAARPFAEPTVIGIGRLTKQKGFDVLLRALEELPDVCAVIVGDGPERHELEQLSSQLGLSDRVRFTGWLDDAERLLPSVDVFVLPSRYEVLPHVILEAMHAGLPVVAADVGSVREAVRPGETGLLVPPDDATLLADAIRSALDPATARELGSRASAIASDAYTSERMVRDYEHLYRMLLS